MARCLQVGKNLRIVDGCQSVHCLQLNNERLADEQIARQRLDKKSG